MAPLNIRKHCNHYLHLMISKRILQFLFSQKTSSLHARRGWTSFRFFEKQFQFHQNLFLWKSWICFDFPYFGLNFAQTSLPMYVSCRIKRNRTSSFNFRKIYNTKLFRAQPIPCRAAARSTDLGNWDVGNEQNFLKTTTDGQRPPKVTQFYGVIPQIVAFFFSKKYVLRLLPFCLPENVAESMIVIRVFHVGAFPWSLFFLLFFFFFSKIYAKVKLTYDSNKSARTSPFNWFLIPLRKQMWLQKLNHKSIGQMKF